MNLAAQFQEFTVQSSDAPFSLLSAAKSKVWTDTLAIPSYISVLSGIVIVLHLVLASRTFQHLLSRISKLEYDASIETSTEAATSNQRATTFVAEFNEHIGEHGGKVIFGFKASRLLGCVIFVGLSILSAILETQQVGNVLVLKKGKWGQKHKSKHHRQLSFTTKEWLDMAMCMTSLYASMLALFVLSTKLRWSKIVARHLNALLLSIFGVYIYRDVFPLATYDKTPLDLSEGWLVWTKIGILFIISVAIPMIIPRQYVPVDPEQPMAVPNSEQTASVLSLMLYSFLDPVVFLANRIPHLSHDLLPPLADYDQAKVLKAKSFPHLDCFMAGNKRHIFFGLMRIFRIEYTILAAMIIVQVVFSFASPLGIRYLLGYIENDGEDVTIKPWFWIAWLFLGPTVESIAFQWYIFIATRTLVRAECIITQFIFEHALRIRMKSETANNAEHDLSDASTPDSVSVSEPRSIGEESEGETIHSRLETEDTVDKRSEDNLPSSSSTKSASSKNITLPPKKTEIQGDPNSNLVGKINNLVTTDLGNIVDSRDFLYVLLYIPLQITLCIVFLYKVLGWSSFVGLGVIILLFPLPGYVAKLIQDVQAMRLKKTDARIQTVSETMNVLRMVKLFGWEKKMNQRIVDKREEELTWVWRRQILDLINGSLNFLIPVATMLATYSTFSMAVFDMLRGQLHMVFFSISQSVTGKVSLDRINDFLHNTELLDSFCVKGHYAPSINSPEDSNKIGFHNASFTWSNDVDGSSTPSKRKFVLRIEDELIFAPNQINLIIGPTGSGKTSLLMALLGEMHYIPMAPNSWFNIPRPSGIAYAAQESWVQNETIRDNILFGSRFDPDRYNKVIYQCALARDFSLFEAGDQTEVGEKGLTLSGGQKARITLARAIYSPAKTLLLDDILAALDVHTAKWIVDKCLSGDLVRGRTILMVTHNVALAKSVAGFVVAMGSDGRILSQGTMFDVMHNDDRLVKELQSEEEALEISEEDVDYAVGPDKLPVNGKLIATEEVEEGHVSWSALRLYFLGLGGSHPTLFFVTFVVGLGLCEISLAIQTWYLGFWASQYTIYPPSEVRVFHYLGVYGSLLLLATLVYCIAYVIYIVGSIRASRTLHKKLVESVLGTTLRWLDVTPISRVITRCTQDIRAVDGPISSGLWWLSEMTMSMLIKFGAVILLTPAFIFPGILVAILGGWCGQIYIAAQLSVKREMSNAKAPVLGHFGASIAGLTSLRAYDAQEVFIKESLTRIDQYTRAARTFYNLNRWVCIRIDAMGGLFAAGLATYLVYFQKHTASNTGFSLNMAVGFSGMILWWVRVLNDFEVQGNSLERIEKYIAIEQEPKPVESGVPPASWPLNGNIHVEGLSASYSSEGPKVLQDVSFDIKSGERVGVVGRTGSGKSSLTLALLRCIFTEGKIFYGERDTSTINLDSLRSSITIIPQIPELLSGTLRQNLDPFDQYDDATLNDALRSAGLFALQQDVEESRVTLDSQISSGGSNLSVGQRQIIALGRAIVRNSKLLILDEATSAIDHKTDAIIQTSLRQELRDVTVVTVAHRLQTIMDADKIMVLDAGRIVEFDNPKNLLANPGSKLHALVAGSGDMDALIRMAEGSDN